MPITNPKSKALLEYFNNKGCLIRMLIPEEGKAAAEIEALQINEAGGLMIRPSSLIHRDIKAPTYYNEKPLLGIFFKPSASRGAYKQMTYSDNVELIIKKYDEEKMSGEILM